MGYTHRWERPQIIAASTFNTITEDFKKALPPLEAAGSPIANAYELEEPELPADYVRFNCVQHCGHTKNPEVRLAGPTRDASGIGGNYGMGAALPYRTCNGDCSYESFWFDRCLERSQQGTACTARIVRPPSGPTTLPLPSSCSLRSTISEMPFGSRAMERQSSGRMRVFSARKN